MPAQAGIPFLGCPPASSDASADSVAANLRSPYERRYAQTFLQRTARARFSRTAVAGQGARHGQGRVAFCDDYFDRAGDLPSLRRGVRHAGGTLVPLRAPDRHADAGDLHVPAVPQVDPRSAGGCRRPAQFAAHPGLRYRSGTGRAGALYRSLHDLGYRGVPVAPRRQVPAGPDRRRHINRARARGDPPGGRLGHGLRHRFLPFPYALRGSFLRLLLWSAGAVSEIHRYFVRGERRHLRHPAARGRDLHRAVHHLRLRPHPLRRRPLLHRSRHCSDRPPHRRTGQGCCRCLRISWEPCRARRSPMW